MQITIGSGDLQSIKEYLRHSLPEHKSSHRIEAAARGLGYATYGGLLEEVMNNAITVSADDQRFCDVLEIPFAIGEEFNRHLSRAIARVQLHRVLDAYPRLTQCGFDSAWMRVSSEMGKPLSERIELLNQRRQEAYESDWGFDQFELAWIYLSRQQKIKSINRRTNSYGLKHGAENLMCSFGHFRPLGNYVSNGMLIAAAYTLGFEVKPIGLDSYNACLNISMVSVRRSRGKERGSFDDQNPELVAAMYADLDRIAA